jgi:hypothetical protein
MAGYFMNTHLRPRNPGTGPEGGEGEGRMVLDQRAVMNVNCDATMAVRPLSFVRVNAAAIFLISSTSSHSDLLHVPCDAKSSHAEYFAEQVRL